MGKVENGENRQERETRKGNEGISESRIRDLITKATQATEDNAGNEAVSSVTGN